MFYLQYANVLRSGNTYEIKAEEIALGDIVDVKFGDRVPADVRVITAHSFKVNTCIFFNIRNQKSTTKL